MVAEEKEGYNSKAGRLPKVTALNTIALWVVCRHQTWGHFVLPFYPRIYRTIP